MIEFVVKYWLQVVFGVIATGLAVSSKKIYNALTEMINRKIVSQCSKEIGALKVQLTEDIQKLVNENQMQNEKTQTICDGVLNIYSNQFKSYCRMLLQEHYVITLDEFENCQTEYEMYKKMGGNGQGDALYKLVLEKAAHNLANK